jgi:bis(5'-nucleosyl)-tetraphosphatase (symmetrical)
LIRFDRKKERLWLVGDIVNRGPASLSVLRYVKALGETAVMVLGNHDLHLLTVAEGCGKINRNDTVDDILAAPDREELLCWLRRRPLLYMSGNYVMVHAGLLPSWSIPQASKLAKLVEDTLRGSGFHELCAHMYGNDPDHWDENLGGYERLRVVINAMTRMRVCTPEGKMNLTHKGPERDIPQGYMAWFEAPARKSRDATIICGHWSALGLKVTDNILALDTGCLWGGSLTAIRLEDRKVFQVACAAGEGIRQWQ